MAAKTQDAAASTGESSAKSDAVQVAVRVRPLSTSEASQGSKRACKLRTPASCWLRSGSTSMLDNAAGAQTKVAMLKLRCVCTNVILFVAFEFAAGDRLHNVVAPMVDKFFCGYNATVFAYGQTGSGKT
ncbi:Kinesin-like protein [Phytophthora cactorum]|nr:Kinesin-like protein [Phytophthora cactorum]